MKTEWDERRDERRNGYRGEPRDGHRAEPRYEAVADALCDIEYVFFTDRRKHLTQKLPREVWKHLGMNAPAIDFARQLVHLCQEYVRLGCLVRWVLFLEDGGQSARAVALAAEPLLREEEWRQISSVLPDTAAADVDLVREELRGYAPDRVTEPFDLARAGQIASSEVPPDTAWDRFVDLVEMPVRGDGELPVSVFCSLLPHYLRLAVCADLVDLWGGGLREAPVPVPGSRTPARLVVQLSQGERRDRYDVEYWTVLSEKRGDAPVFCGHGLSRGMVPENIGDHLGGLLTLMEVDHRTGHHEGKRVELVGRLNLLRRLEAERWQEAGDGARRLGARAEVVYRAEELVDGRGGEAGRTRARRWDALEGNSEVLHLDASFSAGIQTETGGKSSREPLVERLKDDRILVLSAPSHLNENECYTLVWSAITIGVPVVVWRSANNGPGIGPWLNLGREGREVTVSPEKIRAIPEVLHRSRSGCVSPDDSGYIEESFEVAVFYHDSLPVLPDPPQMTTDSIR